MKRLRNRTLVVVVGMMLVLSGAPVYAQDGAEEDLYEEEMMGPPTEEQQREWEEEAFLEEEEGGCDPVDYEELKLLGALQARSAALKEREIILEEKDILLREIEEQLEAKFKKLTAKLDKLEKLLEVGKAESEARQERFARLVEALTTLSPRKAAPILEKADQRFATRLLQEVSPVRVGKLLAQMTPGNAATLMVRLDRAKTVAQRAASKGARDWKAGAKGAGEGDY
ncbi:MAG: hypothetical protein VX699_02965 [Myxococcota bacterium]|nr:hypothetical protein [Myxococcota bacterium]